MRSAPNGTPVQWINRDVIPNPAIVTSPFLNENDVGAAGQ